ncbi:MAG: hypothetical protein ACQESG_06345 [Nanobdellota archaeon]
MQIIEIMIYTAIALIVGAMIFTFVKTMDYGMLRDKIGLFDDRKIEFEKVNKKTFINRLLLFWEDTGHCKVAGNVSYYVFNETTGNQLSKDYIFDRIKEIHMCKSLQSGSHDCGVEDDVKVPSTINLPNVIRLNCDVANNQVVVT